MATPRKGKTQARSIGDIMKVVNRRTGSTKAKAKKAPMNDVQEALFDAIPEALCHGDSIKVTPCLKLRYPTGKAYTVKNYVADCPVEVRGEWLTPAVEGDDGTKGWMPHEHAEGFFLTLDGKLDGPPLVPGYYVESTLEKDDAAYFGRFYVDARAQGVFTKHIQTAMAETAGSLFASYTEISGKEWT